MIIMKKIQTKQSGFSLIEILIGITMVGLVIVAIGNIPEMVRISINSSQQSLANDIASKKIEDLRLLTYDSLADSDVNNPPVISDSRLKQLPESQGYYTIADCPATICKSNPIESTKLVTVVVKWRSGTTMKNVTLTTLISEGGLH